MNNIKKNIIIIIVILIIFIGGVFVGSKINYKPSVYSKYCTDDKTGVQYIVIVSKDGDVAICPRLNTNGTLYIENKNRYIFVEDIKEKLNEQTNFNSNQ